MKKLAPLLAAFALTACAAPETWQVVGVSTDPNLPSELPPDAAGTANFRLQGDRLRGATPCAAVSADVSLNQDVLTLDSVEVSQPEDCTGGARHAHEQLASLLKPGASFDVLKTGPTERLLISTADLFDRPSVRVMSL